MVTLQNFMADSQGRRFTDVVADSRIPFQHVVDFFNDPARRLRMEDSETHHDRPPLAGVIKEFELDPLVGQFLGGHDGHTTRRFRQAIGVLVRLHMESMGWVKKGEKGSLGRRIPVEPGTTTPGAYVNQGGLSKWFTRAERYSKPTNVPGIIPGLVGD
ncbi:MAG: hypothetical protein Q8N51_13780 [Gammaproteobacteria bacterium]|nr:hypothetical protein [Gammaproteobacteria bacterium]